MNKYISTIDLGDNGNEFAQRIGVISIASSQYICASITEDGELYHSQTFSVEKSINGLPANQKTLEADVLKGWKSHLEKTERSKTHD